MKKLIALLMIALLLAGCSGKKEVPVKEEKQKEEVAAKPESTDPFEGFYGT